MGLSSVEFRERLSTKVENIVTTQVRTNPEGLDNLFHYTSPMGLKRILSQTQIDTCLSRAEEGQAEEVKDSTTYLQAGHLAFMNDAREIQHGHDVIDRELEIFAEKSTGITEEFFTRLREKFNPFEESLYDAYAFCLTERGDLLSQWQAYTEQGVGYSIGFDAEQLKKRVDGSDGLVKFRKVMYKPEVQKELIRSILGVAKTMLDGEDLDNEQASVSTGVYALRNELADLIWTFKHPTYEEEQEWRIVVTALSAMETVDHMTGFHEYNGRLRPFHRIDVTYEEDFERDDVPSRIGKLPIQEIVMGSGVKSMRDRTSLDLLLKKHGYWWLDFDADIYPSSVPLQE